MSEYIFGTGPGHLPARTRERIEELGAEVVNHTDPGDRCGRGCKPFHCPKAKRHWLTIPETGIAAQTARSIIAQLNAEGLLPEVK